MGKGRDKRKKNKGSSIAGHGATKTAKKTQQNDMKKQRRADEKEEDIDAILAQLDGQGAAQIAVEENCQPPGPRVCGLWVALDQQAQEDILLFGGELWDTAADRVTMYADIYKYSTGKDRWTRIRSKGPHPRSACAGTVFRGCLYMFGGEYTSANQNKFKHFKDLWRLNLSTWEWDTLPCSNGPSARSGHRMLCHKGVLYVFGGYYDTGADLPRYYRDLWAYDTTALRWTQLGDATQVWPSARSGYQWVAHEERLVMHGGYSKRRDDDEEDIEHGVTLDDMWSWSIKDGKWERLQKLGMAPSKRASFAMVKHKQSAYLFGGTADEEYKRGESMISRYFNDLYQYRLAQGRWYPAAFRPAAASKQAAAMDALTERVGRMLSEQESKQHAAATRIQAHYRGHVVRKAMKVYRIGGMISEVLYSPAAFGLDLSSRNAPKPRARINPNACVVKNTLWLLGGIVEVGDVEVTLDDLWKVDLNKMDGWVLVKDNTAGEAAFKETNVVSSDDEDE